MLGCYAATGKKRTTFGKCRTNGIKRTKFSLGSRFVQVVDYRTVKRPEKHLVPDFRVNGKLYAKIVMHRLQVVIRFSQYRKELRIEQVLGNIRVQ